MGSTPKIVSTPLKWASKKLAHTFLLRFADEKQKDHGLACVYCPEMCRFSCPTAVVTGNDVVTPSNKMGLLFKEKTWPQATQQGQSLWPIYDCTGCGRCTEYCLHDVPVANQLFQARQTHKWPHAESVAQNLSDTEDPVGDLAFELGDLAQSTRRLQNWVQKQKLSSTPHLLLEPKSVTFLRDQGQDCTFQLESFFQALSLTPTALKVLTGTSWLLHESSWMNRHLKLAAWIPTWMTLATQAGLSIHLPFEHGEDCTDCGGEGAYSKLFPEQARLMALDIFERNRTRAQGVLCVSTRCATHLRKSLRTPPFSKNIVALEEIL